MKTVVQHPKPVMTIVPSIRSSSSSSSSFASTLSSDPTTKNHVDRSPPGRLTTKSANQLPPIWWSNIIFFASVHLIGVYGAIFISPIHRISNQTIFLAILSWQLATFGITVGYHRLWSHRSFKASIGLRWLLSLMGCLGFQGSIKWWVLRHRLHHRWTDSDSDPYNSKRGLFFSHMGWIFRKPKYEKLKLIDRSDLDNDPVVNFQHKHYIPLSLFLGFIAPYLLSEFILKSNVNSTLDGLIWAGFISRILIWHFTFLINSFAHYFGERLFDLDISARSNFLLAIFTGGEANHNYHHVFPKDYRNGPGYLDWDPSKWIIYLLHRYTNLVPKVHCTHPDEVEQVRQRVLKITSSKRKNGRPSQFEDIHHISLLSSSSSSSSDAESESGVNDDDPQSASSRRRFSAPLQRSYEASRKPTLERWKRDEMLMKLVDYYEANYSFNPLGRSRQLSEAEHANSDHRETIPQTQRTIGKLHILVIDNTLVDVTKYFNSAQHPGGNRILKKYELNLGCLQDLQELVYGSRASRFVEDLVEFKPTSPSSEVDGHHDHPQKSLSSRSLSIYRDFDRFKDLIEYNDCSEEFLFELNIHSNFALLKMKEMRIARLIN